MINHLKIKHPGQTKNMNYYWELKKIKFGNRSTKNCFKNKKEIKFQKGMIVPFAKYGKFKFI